MGRMDTHPRRMTPEYQNIGSNSLSADGKTIAFVANNDLYVIPVNGCVERQVTFLNAPMAIIQWRDANTIVIASSHNHPFNQSQAHTVCIETGHVAPMPLGPCTWMDMSSDHHCVIQRHGYGYPSWQRYTGGTAGQLWVKTNASDCFKRILSHIKHNMMHPCIVGTRIYFLSDHTGVGNIHSCTLDGDDVRQHTHHDAFYAQHLRCWDNELVYQCSGVIWTYDIQKDSHKEWTIDLSRDGIAQKMVRHNPADFVSAHMPSCDGKKIAVVTRGRLFDGTPHKGPMRQKGPDAVRYHWTTWLHNGTLLALADHGTSDRITLFNDNDTEPMSYDAADFQTDWGRLVSVQAQPSGEKIACTNHRHELFIIDLDQKQSWRVAHSAKGPFQGYNWSPCGQWLVYSASHEVRKAHIALYELATETTHRVTDDPFSNTCPVFDADGRYIFFTSDRALHPEWDELSLSMVCHDTAMLFAVTLQKDDELPFFKPLVGLCDDDKDDEETIQKDRNQSDAESHDQNDTDAGQTDANSANKESSSSDAIQPTKIDIDTINKRIGAFPLPSRPYAHLIAVKNHLLYVIPDKKMDIYAYDLSTLKEDVWLSGVESLSMSPNHQWMMVQINKKLRTVKADAKPDDSPDTSFKNGGWLNWERINLSVHPQKEWGQMFDEAWRLQKDMFWMDHMGNVDWQDVYRRYRPCIDRAACNADVERIIGDMQGELGTSHAYVMTRPKKAPSTNGTLGAGLDFVPDKQAYRITSIMHGDAWTTLPLCRPGLNINVGDLIWSLAGQTLSADVHPTHVLRGQANNAVPMTISDSDGNNKRTVVVFPGHQRQEKKWLYRQWVDNNRKWIHDTSNGRAGYVHIPDMGAKGYGEFLRGYLQEFDRPGLIIDARYNGGGNISYLIIDLLKRHRIGYDQSRHQGAFCYPSDAPRGPMVALVNEYTGSDGDIFSHAFKKMGLGPTIGQRTWGGVVGIWPRYNLIDGTMTTQPEYSFWFHDCGWSIENKGVDPDILVDITPEDAHNKHDSQMERAWIELKKMIQAHDAQNTPPPTPCLKRP